ncbi:MAG: polysaccharide biosynthesis C-terminal domain-containing protein [Clostridia bacterium]|nr:polysaccharide biosynthesis C-terminal domain-containing protein [Clostridia bacterium]
MKKAEQFLINGLLLSVVSLLLRTVGVSFNAYLTARMGATGTGIYQLLMSVYSPALTLATAGIHLAVTRLVAEELEKPRTGLSRAVLRKCLHYALTVSGAVGGLLFLLSETAAVHWLSSPETASLLRILSLGLPFIALSSAMNGYFTAVRRVSKTAMVQLLEQAVRIGLTVCALTHLWKGGTASCLLLTVASSVSADVFSCLITATLCRIDAARLARRHTPEEKGILSRILAITLPVSFSSFLRSGLVAVEHLLIPRGLRKSGASFETAMASYGTLTGMAMPIIFFPASFLYSFTGLLIPELAEAREMGRRKEIALLAERVVKTVLIYGIGAAGILLCFSGQLGLAVYQNAEAARYIRVIAPLIPVMYLDTAVDSILKGLGEQVYTMRVNIVDAFVSVVAVWLLVPRMGLNGYIAVIFISELINFSFSFVRMTAVSGAKGVLFRHTVKPILAVIAAGFGTRYLLEELLPFLSPSLEASFGIALAAVGYLCLLLILGVIPPRRFLIFFQRMRRAPSPSLSHNR